MLERQCKDGPSSDKDPFKRFKINSPGNLLKLISIFQRQKLSIKEVSWQLGEWAKYRNRQEVKLRRFEHKVKICSKLLLVINK